MTVQLALLTPAAPVWKISDETREIGRRGLAEARAALHSNPRTRYLDDAADRGADAEVATPARIEAGALGAPTLFHPAAA